MLRTEAILYHYFNKKSALMNGTVPAVPSGKLVVPAPANTVQVMDSAEIDERKSVELRLSRQAQHYAQILGHFLVVKNSDQIARAMNAHFERLTKYHRHLGRLAFKEREK